MRQDGDLSVPPGALQHPLTIVLSRAGMIESQRLGSDETMHQRVSRLCLVCCKRTILLRKQLILQNSRGGLVIADVNKDISS